MPWVVGKAAGDSLRTVGRGARDGANAAIVHTGFGVDEKQLIAAFGRLWPP